MFDSTWVERIGWMLLHSVWQIALVAVVYAWVASLLRSRSANSRYLVGCVAILLMVFAPVVTLCLSQPTSPLVTDVATATSDVPQQGAIPESHESDFVVLDKSSQSGTSQDFARVRATAPLGWLDGFMSQRIRPMLPMLVILWVIGVVLLKMMNVEYVKVIIVPVPMHVVYQMVILLKIVMVLVPMVLKIG